MQATCVAVLDVARDLLEFGMVGEGAGNLVTLRRCAHRLGCADWQDCRCRVQRTWQDGPRMNSDGCVTRAVRPR